MRLTGTSKPCVWRWQERYIAEGVEGLLRDKTRPPGKKPLSAAVKRKVLSKTASELPPNATHWSRSSMAAAMRISPSSVGRIWAEAGLNPHLVRRFKVSNDPQFEEKVHGAQNRCCHAQCSGHVRGKWNEFRALKETALHR